MLFKLEKRFIVILLYGNCEPGLGIDIKEEAALKYPHAPVPKPVPPGDTWTTVRGVDGSLVKP